MNQLKITVASSLPMRHMFVRQVPESLTSSKIIILQKASASKMDKVTQQVFWLLRTLWEDGQDLFLAGMPLVVDELDRLLRADPRAREMVSPYVARLIGELSIVAECLRQLNTYQPWANGFENAMVDRESAIKKDFAKRTQTEARIMEALRDETLVKAGIQTLGEPSKLDYPIGKRRNKAVMDALRAAEANLDFFWSKTDDLLRSKVGSNLNGTALMRFLSQPRPLKRTSPWIEPAKGKEKSGLAPSLKSDIKSITTPLSSIFLGCEAPSARKEILASSTTKSKVKSRGTPQPTAVESSSTLPVRPQSTDPQPTFEVEARALKVFHVIFFDPGANTTLGEVAWTDFVHALDCVGFRAQKLYGSVWHFQPTTLDVERSIQFHEPHPQGKISFLIARRHGRRLNRAYGWVGSMFVLKAK